MKNTVTVAIPVFNGEVFILKALESIIDQTIQVDEIIICDNNSTDDTILLVKSFINRHQTFNFRLLENKENIGFQKNFKKCYEVTKTDFLLILHADDVLKKDTIELQLDFFKINPHFAIVGGNSDGIDEDDNLLKETSTGENQIFLENQILEFIRATGSYIPFSSVMYNLKLTKNIDYLEKESVGEDELYWPVLLQKYPIALLGKSLVFCRTHSNQAHVSISSNNLSEYINYFNDKLKLSNLEIDDYRQKETKKILKVQISKLCVYIAQEIMKFKNDRYTALKYYCYAIKYNFRIIFSIFFLKSFIKHMVLGLNK